MIPEERGTAGPRGRPLSDAEADLLLRCSRPEFGETPDGLRERVLRNALAGSRSRRPGAVWRPFVVAACALGCVALLCAALQLRTGPGGRPTVVAAKPPDVGAMPAPPGRRPAPHTKATVKRTERRVRSVQPRQHRLEPAVERTVPRRVRRDHRTMLADAVTVYAGPTPAPQPQEACLVVVASGEAGERTMASVRDLPADAPGLARVESVRPAGQDVTVLTVAIGQFTGDQGRVRTESVVAQGGRTQIAALTVESEMGLGFLMGGHNE